MTEATLEDRRAMRLAQLAARDAEDRARLADDAALDLPVLEEFVGLIDGDLAMTIARLDGVIANLVRRSTATGLGLPFQMDQIKLIRGNLLTISQTLATEAQALISADANATGG